MSQSGEVMDVKRRELYDFGRWGRIFEAKRTRGELLPWSDSYKLSAGERHTIADSIAQFELGENAQGRSLRAAARRYAESSGDWSYLSALDLFIEEEQRHSHYLRKFMIIQRLPLAGAHWVDETFRWLRTRAGLELFVVVLVTAEIVAQPYYRALRAATNSPLLQEICRAILRDEAQHLCFQGNVLRKLRQRRSGVSLKIWEWLHHLLMMGTCTVVWHSHRKVLACGGYSLGSFTAACRRTLRSLHGLARTPLVQGN